MLLIGLTGSIATGKSTVSALLSASPYSLPVVDADVIARQVVAPGTRGYRAVVLACYLRGHWAVVLDVPLLFEGALDRFCGVAMVVAVADRETQLARLMARDSHLSREDAENRVRSQADVAVKAQRCAARGPGRGVVLWNDGSKEELAASLDAAIVEMRKSSPEWWSWTLLACPPLAVVLAAWQFWQNVRLNRQWEKSQSKTPKEKL
ncbi:hypothetical protein HIM_07760 [Hirsutella minnesotensis 3608]|uniref:Dephospho-CoA kinase n=1 Tax=Hirsutella minnesotensis 3608 TaxID=1043627 RepID=A0A0F7ZHK8_9HYPO|nr:hypothetical protein HIM_07760 [Hirsutella minnesotensis 3608]